MRLILEVSLVTVGFSLSVVSVGKVRPMFGYELRSKFLRFVYDGTVITWPWSFLNTCHSHLMLRGGARIGRVWWKV